MVRTWKPTVEGQATLSEWNSKSRSTDEVGFVANAYKPTFSPDGAQLAFISDRSGLPQVWRASSSSDPTLQVTSFEDRVSDVLWSPDGAHLAVEVAHRGGLSRKVYVMRPDGTGIFSVLDAGDRTLRLNCWSRDGRHIGLCSNHEARDDLEPYRYDIRTKILKRLAQGGGVWWVKDLSAEGAAALLVHSGSASATGVYLVDLRRGTRSRLVPRTGEFSILDARLGTDDKSVYIVTNLDSEFSCLARWHQKEGNRESKSIEVLARKRDSDLEAFAMKGDGSRIALLWNVRGLSALTFLNPWSMRSWKGPKLPGTLTANLTYSNTGDKLAAAFSGPRIPREIWVLDRGSDEFRQLTFSSPSGVPYEDLVAPEPLSFVGDGGLELTGWLYRPTGVIPRSCVVLSIHGGPQAQERPRLDWTYQVLLKMGFSVFAPNVRGSTGFGRSFAALDDLGLRWNAIGDVGAAGRAMIESHVASQNGLMIMGGSYGGFLALSALAQFPDLFRSAAVLCGIPDLESYLNHSDPGMAPTRIKEYGHPDKDRELLRALSPVHRVDRIQSPLLVMHGALDKEVPISEIERFVEKLRLRNVSVRFVRFPNEGHGVFSARNRGIVTREIADWFVRFAH